MLLSSDIFEVLTHTRTYIQRSENYSDKVWHSRTSFLRTLHFCLRILHYFFTFLNIVKAGYDHIPRTEHSSCCRYHVFAVFRKVTTKILQLNHTVEQYADIVLFCFCLTHLSTRNMSKEHECPRLKTLKRKFLTPDVDGDGQGKGQG